MIGPEERLMALGVPAETAREMVRIFGGGSGGTPLIASNNLSDLTNVAAALVNLGLGALANQSAVQTQQTGTATLSGAGTPTDALQVNVRVSADPDNVLVAEEDGLRVPASASGIPEAPDDGFVYGRGSASWQQLAPVATSGSYADLTGKPTIPPAPVNADWNANSGLAQILNKPTIPAAQVNADWNATSGVAQILNKPALSAVAISGSYDDLTGKPAIPTSPGGDFVGTTAEQMLSNKFLGVGTRESYSTSAVINITLASAPFQQITLTANVMATINLEVGVSRTIWLNPGTYTVTWPAGTILVGDIEDLPASKWSLITLTGMPGNTAGVAALVVSQP